MQHAAEQLTMTTLLRAGNAALAAGGMQQFCNLQVQLFEQYLRAGSNFRAFQLRTQRAKAPLQSIEDMISYNAFYGARHYSAFWELLWQVAAHDFNKGPVSLKVFDYGCGQGMATLALLTALQGHCHYDIDLHLVEPSKLALDAAWQYANTMKSSFPGKVFIHKHNCSLDALPDYVFTRHPKAQTLHLFSNILDMAATGVYDLQVLLRQIKRIPGRQGILAISPSYIQRNAQHGQTNSEFGFRMLEQFFPTAVNALPYCSSHNGRGFIDTICHDGLRTASATGKMQPAGFRRRATALHINPPANSNALCEFI